MNQNQLQHFINKLISFPQSSTVTNQYLNETQLSNLKQYLSNLDQLSPTILFVGEAPGYKGCRISGIPFTSEYIIHTHQSSGVLAGCKALGNQKEASASIIWQKLDELDELGKLKPPPLIWNIFPFHPHKNGINQSNRKPLTSEVQVGLTFLDDLINLFPSIKHIYAIGKVSANIIHILPQYKGIIRHPANGGKKQMNIDMDHIFV